MKTTEAIMEILAAYDLTHSYRDAAALVGRIACKAAAEQQAVVGDDCEEIGAGLGVLFAPGGFQ